MLGLVVEGEWAAALIVLSFIGILASLFPYIVPYEYTFYAVANDRGSLIFASVGILVVLPVVVLYLLLGYRVFQGKIADSSVPAAAAPSIAFRRSSGHRSDLHMSSRLRRAVSYFPTPCGFGWLKVAKTRARSKLRQEFSRRQEIACLESFRKAAQDRV